MEKTRCIVARLLLSVMVFLSLAVFFQERSSAETMISSPLPSKGGKGLVEGWENSWFGAGYFDGKSTVKDDEGHTYDMDISQLYGEIGYRIDPWKEVFARVGSAEFDIEGLRNSSGKLFLTGGVNYKWYISRDYSIWTSGQITYYFPQKFTNDNNTEQSEMNYALGWHVALGADYKIPITSFPNLLSVYGGLVATHTNADMDVTNISTGVKSTTSINTENYFGAFAGLRVFPLNGFNIDIEGQFVDRFSFGLKLVYAFPVDH